MFVTDSRISLYIDGNTWVLVLYKVIPEDQATYECHVNSERSQKLAINLSIKGKIDTDRVGIFTIDKNISSSSHKGDGCIWKKSYKSVL